MLDAVPRITKWSVRQLFHIFHRLLDDGSKGGLVFVEWIKVSFSLPATIEQKVKLDLEFFRRQYVAHGFSFPSTEAIAGTDCVSVGVI